MITRQAYMAHEATHRQYHGQFVTPAIKSLVRLSIGIAALRASTDPHLNDIPLHRWDALVQHLGVAAKVREAGDWLSLGTGVCIAKEAARQIIEGGGTRHDQGP